MKLFYYVFFLFFVHVGIVSSAPLSIAEFSRDRVLFDVGAAFGRDRADIPVSGEGEPGQSVGVRWVNDQTGTTGEWVEVGTVGANERWSGAITLGASPDWFRLEARSQSDQVATATRFGTGDVVAILGQSEFERLWLDHFSRLEVTQHPVLNSDQVQFTLQRPRRGITHHFADASATHAMNAFADFWIANAPTGRKLHLIDLAQSGTARAQLQDDSNEKRNWSDLVEMIDWHARDGVQIGLILESWFAGDRGTGTDWAQRFMPFYTGVTVLGRDVRRGSLDSKDVPIDHFLWDISGGDEGIFTVGQTALGVFGPHRFETESPLSGAIDNADGSIAYGLRQIERSRVGVATFLNAPILDDILVDMNLPQPIDYANGFVDVETGEYSDYAHPSYVTPDGQQRLAKHTANAAIVALGHLEYEIPIFDQILRRGRTIEISSSAGAITTARRERRLPELGQGHPHWTDVLGFEVNGRAIQRAEITDGGAVLLYPNPGEEFRRGDVVSFGRGGAGGFMMPAQDWSAAAYLNYPIVDVGLIGLEGVALFPGINVTLQ